ncbi:MAG: hypothetical protein KAT68_11765 [Bacteroidales bacterium]|nr:hypothetical protein [Bacteroidales bacterium]
MSNQVYRNKEKRYDLVNGSSGRWVLTSAQSIPTGTTTLVNTWVNDLDDGIFQSIIYSAGRFTIQTSGVYSIFVSLGYTENINLSRKSHILYNDGSITRLLGQVENGSKQAGTNLLYQNPSTIIKMKKGDFVEIYGYQNSGSSLNFVGNVTDPRCEILITRIA